MSAFFSYVFKRVKREHEWTRAKSNYNEMTTNWCSSLLQGFRSVGTYREVGTGPHKLFIDIKVIIEKSRGDMSLMEQDTIQNVS